MQVTDLGGLDGMAFRYDSPHTTSFTMRNTVMPLSIAFFGADGAFLDAFDMEPCVAEPCPSYPTPADFLVAIEVPQGGLPDLGIGAGSTLELLAEGCSAADAHVVSATRVGRTPQHRGRRVTPPCHARRCEQHPAGTLPGSTSTLLRMFCDSRGPGPPAGGRVRRENITHDACVRTDGHHRP